MAATSTRYRTCYNPNLSHNSEQWVHGLRTQLHAFFIQPDPTNVQMSFIKSFPPHQRCWGTSGLICGLSVITSRFPNLGRPSYQGLLFFWLAKLLEHTVCSSHKHSTQRHRGPREPTDWVHCQPTRLPFYTHSSTWRGNCIKFSSMMKKHPQTYHTYPVWVSLNTARQAPALYNARIITTSSTLKFSTVLILFLIQVFCTLQSHSSRRPLNLQKKLTCENLVPGRFGVVLPFFIMVALHHISSCSNLNMENKKISSWAVQSKHYRPIRHVGVFTDDFPGKNLMAEVCLVSKITPQVRFFSRQPLFSAPTRLHADGVCAVYRDFQRKGHWEHLYLFAKTFWAFVSLPYVNYTHWYFHIWATVLPPVLNRSSNVVFICNSHNLTGFGGYGRYESGCNLKFPDSSDL